MSTITLEKTIFFEGERTKLFYLPEYEAVMMVQDGDQTHEELMKAFTSVLPFSKEHTIKRLIVDERKLKGIPTKHRVWMTTKFLRMPEVKELITKIENTFIIKSQNRFGAAVANLVQKAISRISGIEFTHMDDPEQVFERLEKMKNLKW